MPKEIGGTGKSHFDLNGMDPSDEITVFVLIRLFVCDFAEDMYKLMVSSRDWYLSLEN